METPQATVQPQFIQCPYCPRPRWGFFRSFFRFIGLLILLALVFAAGLLIGGIGLAGTGTFTPDVFGDVMFKAGTLERGIHAGPGGFAVRFDSGGRVFGVVTVVDGSKVTIADNGGGTQTIVSTPATVVMDGDKEVPVWSLRRGNSVRVFTSGDDDMLSARLIEIIR